MVLLTAAACNSSGEGENSEDTASSNITPVQNVNGNLPDTSNSVNLSGGDTTSSTQDTVPGK